MADEDAPWLAEAAPLKPEGRKRPWLNLVIIVLAVGTVIALALLMLLGRREGGSSEGYMEAAQAPLIEADPGPIKVPPEDRQGLEVDGIGEVIHGAVRGEGVESQIDLGAMPEEPIGRPRDLLPPVAQAPQTTPPPAITSPPVTATRPEPGSQPVPVQVLPPPGAEPAARRPAQKAPPPPAAILPAPSRTAPLPVRTAPPPVRTAPPPAAAAATPIAPKAVASPPPAGSALVQIGAFSSAAKADEEWARVAGKAGLTGKRVENITTSTGRSLWRLRGTAADPAKACAAITAMGGACETVRK